MSVNVSYHQSSGQSVKFRVEYFNRSAHAPHGFGIITLRDDVDGPADIGLYFESPDALDALAHAAKLLAEHLRTPTDKDRPTNFFSTEEFIEIRDRQLDQEMAEIGAVQNVHLAERSAVLKLVPANPPEESTLPDDGPVPMNFTIPAGSVVSFLNDYRRLCSHHGAMLVPEGIAPRFGLHKINHSAFIELISDLWEQEKPYDRAEYEALLKRQNELEAKLRQDQAEPGNGIEPIPYAVDDRPF